jgi:hypothetical protein
MRAPDARFRKGPEGRPPVAVVGWRETAPVKAQRTGPILRPDSTRVFVRPFEPSDRLRTLRIVARVPALEEREVRALAQGVLREFGDRHQEMRAFLLERFADVQPHLVTDHPLTADRRLLLGAYLTQEYSLEAAALFNPSLVRHPDQSGLPAGSVRFVLSLRATGEGHISSIVFRSGVVDGAGGVTVNKPTRFVRGGTAARGRAVRPGIVRAQAGGTRTPGRSGRRPAGRAGRDV